jgi:amino acid transporter
MHSKVASLAIVVAICLIHFSYVDFRYRHRGSVLWFWLAGPAPLLLWISRAAIVLCLLVAISGLFFGVTVVSAVIMVVLVLVHIITLIVVEVREDDWVPPGPPQQ